MKVKSAFDAIPQAYDRYRPRYCPELFAQLEKTAQLGPDKSILEIGPGTGQATGPLLATGCRYLAIELGEHLAGYLQQTYGSRPNFQLVLGDFATYPLAEQQFDLICAANSLQWLPLQAAFGKTFSLLKPGGLLAVLTVKSDYRTPDPALYRRIQQVYDAHFYPAAPYQGRGFPYQAAADYGYNSPRQWVFHGRRVLTAQGYAGLCQTYSDHRSVPEPHRQALFDGLYQAVKEAGDRIVFLDRFTLLLFQKPQ